MPLVKAGHPPPFGALIHAVSRENAGPSRFQARHAGGSMGSAFVGVEIALAVGLFVGSSSQRAKRARLDYQRTKALIPAARKLAIEETMRGLSVAATAIAVIVGLGFLMYLLGKH